MRFTNVSADPRAIFPEMVTPGISPRAATKVELIYPYEHGVIIHATNGVAYTRLFYRGGTDHSSRALGWIGEKPCGEHPLKELWLHLNRNNLNRNNYGVPPPYALRDLETLVIETDADTNTDPVLPLMLSPNKDGVPSPLLSTLELRTVFDVSILAGILKARSDAGFRLRTLRIGWFYGCRGRTMALTHFVDKLDFYHVDDGTSRGLELPEECMTRGRWWEPWYRGFTGKMECQS